jgi:polysaccharide biosynthesis protein PslH
MKILILCNKSPYPPKEGGPIAMNMIIEGLIDAGHQVKVLAVNSNKYHVDPTLIPEEYRAKTGIEFVDLDLRVTPLGAFLNLFSKKSYHVERFYSGKLKQKLIEILSGERFDVVQFEMLYMSPYLALVRKYSDARIVLRTHNVEHLIWERIAAITSNPVKKRYLGYLAGKLKTYEMSVINWFDGVAAITETDMEFFTGQGCTVPVTAIPFGINIRDYPVEKPTAHDRSLFSIGSMNWIPNQEGIRWFLDHAWNDIHMQYPKLKFYLAGREMPGWLINSNYPNVEVVGEVDDALAFIRSRGIMIVPLFSGSGIRIKIIEGMACGKPVISTTIGAEGIHYTAGENILIADQPCEFFEMVSACLDNDERCARIGQNARKLIEEQYNRDRIIERLTGFYQKIGA